MRILKTVVRVIGIVASIMAVIPGPWQPIAMIVAVAASVVSAGLELAFPAKARANARGSPTEYRLDPQTGIPYMIGRTQYAGTCVKRETYGSEHKFQCFTSVYSLGPIDAIEQFTADRAAITFDGAGKATGALAEGDGTSNMYFASQLGDCPSPVLDVPAQVTGLPNWGANSKMSGLAASHWILRFNKDGEWFTGGPPTPGVVARGVKVYDPRLDSTYPGGSGACIALDESTYVYSDTPHLHALTWALGRWQNGKRRMGIGFPVAALDMAYFVNGANVDEANDWNVSGIVFSTDNKWNVLKQMLEAGCAEPAPLGGKLSGLQSAPRTSIATITSAEVVGRCSVTGTQPRRSRINGGVPRRRSEGHGWEVISDDVVRLSSYVTEDGGVLRTREFEWYLVKDLKQAAQLTAYQIMNAREFGPIELVVKIRWLGLKPGDCVTLDIPELNLNSQKAIVLNRSFDVETGAVSLTLRSETDAKHAAALALNGTAPPAPSLTYLPDTAPAAPGAGVWTLSSVGLVSATGTTPALRFSGTVDNPSATAVEFAYRKVGDTEWKIVGLMLATATAMTVDVTAIIPGASYEGRVRYFGAGKPSAPVTIGPVTVGSTVSNAIVNQAPTATNSDFSAITGSTKPEPNADVTSAITGNAIITIQYDSSNVAKPGQLPNTLNTYKLFKNGVEVTSGVTLSVSTVNGTCSVSINSSTGVLTVTSLTTNATVRVQAVYAGTTRVFDVKLARAVDAIGGGGGGGGSGTSASISSFNTASNAYPADTAPIGGSVIVTAGSAGRIDITGDVEYYKTAAGTASLTGKFRWRLVGGSYADVIAEQAGSTAVFATGEPGSWNAGGQFKTGLTPGSDYEIIFQGKTNTGSVNISGLFNVVGS